MVAEQDDNLGMLSSTMTRLGQMGLAIKDELIAQGSALDELTDEVDSTSSKMKQAQQVMTKLLKSKVPLTLTLNLTPTLALALTPTLAVSLTLTLAPTPTSNPSPNQARLVKPAGWQEVWTSKGTG